MKIKLSDHDKILAELEKVQGKAKERRIDYAWQLKYIADQLDKKIYDDEILKGLQFIAKELETRYRLIQNKKRQQSLFSCESFV